MSDRIPGSSYDNPIWYKGYKIYIHETTGYNFVHKDFDDYPEVNDQRCGYAETVDKAKTEIDWMESMGI